MTHPTKISKKDARRLAVISSGLHQNQPFGKGKSAIVKAIKQIAYVQIDTISVVQRAHHHVLWSRVPGYKKDFLRKLQIDDKELLEFWAHAAAYLPMEDFRFTLPKKRWFKDQKDGWPKSTQELKSKVLERIKMEGPLMARDFEGPKSGGAGWWDWKPAKLALERLYLEGDIVITHRKGFQKVYDLPERHLPEEISTRFPSEDEYADYLIQNAVRSLGLVTSPQVGYLRPGMGKIILRNLQNLVENGQLVKCQVQGLGNTVFYTSAASLQQASQRIVKRIRFLSPFDNLLIQRKRTNEIFGFNYQIECYVPQAKRIYGYFSLPILYGDLLIGRVDCKADRKTNTFHIQNLHMESRVKISEHLLSKIAHSFREFAYFNDCTEIEIHRMAPGQLHAKMKQLFTF